MNLDFLKQLELEVKNKITDYGLAVPSYKQLREQDKRDEEIKEKIENYDLENLLLHFLTIHTRRVPVKKWKVCISKNLEGKTEINEIISMLESGKDINCLLSNRIKKINQTKNPDLLRSEWGIYHLHFKKSRSDELLFVYFTSDSAYLIDILGHEKPDGSVVTWTNTDLIQILHDNWCDVIKQFVYKKDSKTPVLNVEERRSLRNLRLSPQ